MQLSFNRTDMLAIAKKLSKIAPSSSNVEVLTGILIEADADSFEVSLTACNLEVSLCCTMAAAVAESGRAVLNTHLFAGMLSLFGESTVTMEVSPTMHANLSSGNASYTIMAMPANNYPKPMLPATTTEIQLSNLNSLVTKTVFAVSKNKENLALQCIKLEVGNEFMRATGTDGGKLMAFRKEIAANNKPLSLLIPSAAFQLLAGIVNDTDKLTVSATDKQAVFKTDNMTFVTRLGHGTYLDVDSVLASIKKRYEAVVDTGELRSALDMIDVVAAASDRVQMVFQLGSIALSCDGENGTASAQAKAQVFSPMQEEGFYYPIKSLLQCAKAMGSWLQLSVSDTGMLLISNDEQTFMQVPMRPMKKASNSPKKTQATSKSKKNTELATKAA